MKTGARNQLAPLSATTLPLYDLLYSTSAEAMLEMARDPRHLGADIGFLGVLHTWGQTVEHHPHIHYIVPAGGLSTDRSRWIRGSSRFFLPVRAVGRRFRRKFIQGPRDLYEDGKLKFHGTLEQIADPQSFAGFLQLLDKDWVVYAKPPFGGPDLVLNYLARYTHRVAISNYRFLELRDGQVSFLWRDYNDGGLEKTMTLSAHEFLRPFLPHVLPRGPGPHSPFWIVRQPQAQCHSGSLSLAARNRYRDRSSGQPGTTLPHLLRHHADCRAAQFGSTVLSAPGLTTDQDVPCRHVLIRATRSRSPSRDRSASARKRGPVLSNQLLPMAAKAFRTTPGKSRHPLRENARSPARLSGTPTTANRKPRHSTPIPGRSPRPPRGSSLQTIQSKLPRRLRATPSSARRQFRLGTNVFEE